MKYLALSHFFHLYIKKLLVYKNQVYSITDSLCYKAETNTPL